MRRRSVLATAAGAAALLAGSTVMMCRNDPAPGQPASSHPGAKGMTRTITVGTGAYAGTTNAARTHVRRKTTGPFIASPFRGHEP